VALACAVLLHDRVTAAVGVKQGKDMRQC